jgi:hypothetical protein
VVTGAGQIQSGIYASQVARNQAKVAEYNKQLSRENAVDAITRGQDDQRRLGRDVAQRLGQQEARMGANNVDLTFGSAARVTDDTRMIGLEDSSRLAENTLRETRGFQIEAWNYETQKRAAKAEAKQALVSTAFSVASTALGSATQYSKFKAGK